MTRKKKRNAALALMVEDVDKYRKPRKRPKRKPTLLALAKATISAARRCRRTPPHGGVTLAKEKFPGSCERCVFETRYQNARDTLTETLNLYAEGL